MKREMRLKAFTFVELTLVMVIVLLLFTMAMPNFLEARHRADVSRARASLATLSNALENYRVDHKSYPLHQDPLSADGATLTALTTPVQYLVHLPQFHEDWDKRDTLVPPSYVNFQQLLPEGELYSPAYRKGWSAFALIVTGPDGDHDFDISKKDYIFIPYNPTNGTLSNGDIVHFGP